MTRGLLLALAGLVLALMTVAACTTKPTIQGASLATVQAHIDAATRAAGSDLKPFLALCKPAPATRPKGDDHRLAALIAKPAPPPGKAFDNLYFLGDAWVSAWALDTSDGIILLDALNNGKEAARLIEGGLRQLGLDPARIKYIVVTHGHGDHYGGVNYLVGRYRPRVVMSDADWTMTATNLEFRSAYWDAPPHRVKGRDIAAHDGEAITLDGTTVTLYVTPGHTLGAISPVFDVTWHGVRHRVLEWGGTGFNFGADFARLDAYIASTDRMQALAQQQKIDVLISNHSSFDEAPAKLARLRAAPDGSNPFVIGTSAVQRALDVMGECARAQRDRFAMVK
ncbi:MBL fold metallo-hydrolase [Enhydrobacter sp.]|jgi:metallo-beta-lactamase class B|uniref:MBL fold metallo-hydrolase n=1 Tax=Enhydrobacter sp. TaxID=1894999 RepID=UPI002612AE4C|nr:MBL fold metallo-hydrolase [Enhydrobacter sp.]WIM13612.1 MAG: Subclass B3 beta-lactamase [Enhydrobacter sp.]